MHTSIDHPLRWRPRRLRALRPAKRGLLTPATFGVLVMLLAPSAHAQLPMRGLTTSPLTTGPSPAVEDLSRIVTAEAAWIPAERLMVGRNTGYSVRLMAVQIEIQNPFHINPARTQIPPSLSFLIPTEVNVAQAPAGWRARATVYPQPSVVQVAYTGQPAPVPVFHGKIVLLVPFVVDTDAATGPVSVDLRYQACDDRQCLRPQTLSLTVQVDDMAAVQPGGALDAALAAFDVAAFEGGTVPMGMEPADAALNQPVTDPASSRNVSGTDGGGFLLVGYVLLAIIGGFLLNLTPCVLPVIPLKIMGLSRAAASRGRCMALGVAMAAGVVAFWMGLALAIVSVTGFTATNQLFQYPLFTIGVGLVIAAMAVGMCGLFAVRLPQWVYRINPGHDTIVGSVGFGVMTAVLSTPCTAPVMGAALAWATGQSVTITLTVFAALGLGMALPYLVLAAWPTLVQRVPRTGPASELLKQVMGLLMLAAAAYFVGTGVSGLLAQPGEAPTHDYWWAVAALVIAAGAWLIWRTWRLTARPGPRLMFTSLGALAVVLAMAGGLRLTAPGPIPWQYYTPQRFADARAEGKVILLDFTAEWCLNCKALEQTVLHDPRVAQALRAADVAAIKVDLTGDDPDGNAKLAEAGRLTIPLLVIYDRAGQPIFTRDFYTASQVLAAIRQARGG